METEFIAERYRVEAPLGEGGMGEVLRVFDVVEGRELALKRLRGRAHSQAATLRFQREFHTLAGLHHPRIVRVFDYGVDAGRAFYTMELLAGGELRKARDLSIVQICSVLRDVAAALAFLHHRRLIHRDITPRNVFLHDERAKLLDFGVLATVGTAHDVVGTPPYIAPECLLGASLDHRVDLFGLGAMAYWLLTGKHARPGRSLEEVSALSGWRPWPPKKLREDLPATLDELVLALLSPEPLARPASAAEVVDRLTAIGGLPPLADEEIVRGYLASASLVGRKREMRHFDRALQRLAAGKGGALLVEATSGVGKTRLLRELALKVQLSGMTPVSVCAAAGSGSYRVVRDIVEEALRRRCGGASDARLEHAATLAGRFPDLRAKLGNPPHVEPAEDPADERWCFQEAVSGWLLSKAQAGGVVLIVDDFQRCDEASAAVVASLAQGAAMGPALVVVGMRTDEAANAPDAVSAIRRIGQRMRLHGLDRAGVQELVGGLFGSLGGAQRLAQWMHQVAGGNPLHCTELARYLVERKILKHHDGRWLLSEGFDRLGLPRKLSGALDERVGELSEPVLALAQALSVLGGECTVSRSLAVADERDPAGVFRALDRLVAADVLVGDRKSFQFRHDGIREAILRSVGHQRRKSLHLRAARALLAEGALAPELAERIGWHLLRGGQLQQGARLLEEAGRRLYEQQSLKDAVAPLSAAVEAYQRLDASPEVIIDLRRRLVIIGTVCDRDLFWRHAEATLEDAWRYAGLDTAAAFGRVLGRGVGLGVGVMHGGFRRLARSSERRGPNPLKALSIVFQMFAAMATTFSHLQQFERLERLLERMKVCAAFEQRLSYATYRLGCGLLHVAQGDRARVEDDCAVALPLFESDKLTPLSDLERDTIKAMLMAMPGWAAVIDQDPGYRQYFQSARQLGQRLFEMGEAVADAIFHRSRGEESRARAILAEAENLKLRLGPAWTWDGLLARLSVVAYSQTGDLIGLRDAMDRLSGLGDDFQVQEQLLLARGEYHRGRGELETSRQVLEEALGEGRVPMLSQWLRVALAETLLALGQFAQAKERAVEAEVLSREPGTGMMSCQLRCTRILAHLEASAGDVSGALARLGKGLESAAPYQSPTLSGCLHEAAAQIAHEAELESTYRRHLELAAEWFRATENPVLLARIERLEALPRAAEEAATGGAHALTTVVLAAPDGHSFESELGSCRGPEERAACALRILVENSSSDHGLLFLNQGLSLRLAAPQGGMAPSDALIADAQRVYDEAFSTVRDPDDVGTRRLQSEWVLLPLAVASESAGRQLVPGDDAGRGVGIVALRVGAPPWQLPSEKVVGAVAAGLYESGDISITLVTKTSPPPSSD